jgi:hypothetical protein
MMAAIALDFLAVQQDRIVAELMVLRDDLRILARIVQPLDGMMTGALNEIRGSHAQSLDHVLNMF